MSNTAAAGREEIAVIGIGCRFPGSANSPAAFWDLLRRGADAITDIPADRPQLMQVFDPDPSVPGRSYLRRGGFVDGVDAWDASFFGISPREAMHIDPQHRLLLEVAWEALEDAGQDVDRLAGSRTGVFVGISTHDYGDTQCDPANRRRLDSHSNSGSATSIAANRISYLYDLRGPSMTVDTACSSSLTATHLACRSILAGECDLAVVGGVQLQLNPELTIGFCKASMISPTGECRAFDASANGYVRSEGTGVVVLKPLAAALADGDDIYAVIVGSAINQDGRTNGMTVPNPVMQAAMMREALSGAGITAADLHYVEAHGTGTPVGDPLETQALGAVLRDARGAADPCAIGSVKTNIGHLEAASGIAGLIKTVLSIHHRQIPASLHFLTPNPDIDFAGGRMRVVTSLEAWPEDRGRATAGVNSFGFGGANAHVLLREAPAIARRASETVGSAATLLPLSARSPDALTDLARTHMASLAEADAPDIADLASAAAHGRAHHDYRLSIVASTRDEAIDALDAAIAGESRAALAVGRRTEAAGRIAYVFSGMGPQWWGMGQQLRAENRVFRDMLERCHEALKPHAPWGLLDELARDEHTSRIAEPDLAQVTNFAMQVALCAVWESWGITPDAVVGHSAGEMAAAYISGALTLEEAVKVSYHRSRLQSDALPGKIIAVGMAPVQLEQILAEYDGELDLAAVNSPLSCTAAGSAEAITALHERLQRDQVFSRILSFAVAYHSARMEPIRQALTDALSDVRAKPSRIPIISTVTGTWADGTVFGPSYWFENVRRTVRFSDAIDTLLGGGYSTLLEQAPHPVLASSMNEVIAARGAKATVLASLRRKDDERSALLRTLGSLYTRGFAVNWAGVFEGRRGKVKLPAYPWQRDRHWFEPTAPDDVREVFSTDTSAQHPLLGRRVRAARPMWESSLGTERLAFLDDHLIQGTVVFPGAAYIEMALEAAHAMQPDDQHTPVSLRNVAFKRALFLPRRGHTVVQLGLDDTGTRFDVHGTSTDANAVFTLHASGEVRSADSTQSADVNLASVRARCTTEVSHDDCYAALAERGLEYGPAFRGITQLFTGTNEALGRIHVSGAGDAAKVDTDPYQLHPALLDAAFQLLVSAGGGTPSAKGETANDKSGVFLPVGLRDITVYAPAGASFWAHAQLVSSDHDAIEGDITLMDEHGHVLATARGLRCQRIEEARVDRETLDDWLYEYRWENRLLDCGEHSVLVTTMADISARVQPEADALGTEWHWNDYYSLVEPRFTALTLAYMQQAVRQLAGSGDSSTAAVFTFDSLGVSPARCALGEHVLGVLEAHGALRRHDDQFAWQSSSISSDADALARDIAAEHPSYHLDIALLARCGSHLAAVLAGRTDAGSVLFGDEAFDLLTRFYREAPPSRFYNTLAASSIAAAVANRADSRPLRVLELGGGTGGTTAFVLPALSAIETEYVFSDVTPLFTEQAKARFGERAGFSARTLDIEREPATQGFAPNSFDVVLAANVLHATPSLSASLANVRQLLAPGGALVLVEITRRPIWTDLIFGLTDGWWKFEDRDVRTSHPLLSGDAWKRVLTSNGFEDAHAIADTAHDGEAAQSILIARVPDSLAQQVPVGPTDAGDWLIFADRDGAGAVLAEHLSAGGARITMVEPGDAFLQQGDAHYTLPLDDSAATAKLFAALEASERRPRGIVHLWTLDAAKGESISPDDLLETQRAGLGSVLALVKCLATQSTAIPELWLVTGGAQQVDSTEYVATTQAPLWGFGRVITKEQPALRTRLVDIGSTRTAAEVDSLAREVLGGVWEDELALRGSSRHVRRLHRTTRSDERLREPRHHAAAGEGYLAEPGAGTLESLVLRSVPRRSPGAGEVEIAVHAAGMNFRDVLIAMALHPQMPGEASFSGGVLGLDCAGIITACGPGVTALAVGDEVIGIGPGTFGAYVVTPAAVVTKRPASLSITQGAGIPAVFVTAHYSLDYLAHLQRGERVLIHSATGGVGLAAIQVARHLGAEIFATAGSAEKRAYLKAMGIEHVMDSRSLRFADEIMTATHGEGVDVVLNSLAGEAIARGIGVLRDHGRFVEIGKRDIYQDGHIGLLAFRKNLSFFAVDVDRLSLHRPALARDMLREVMSCFERGVYAPLPEHVFGMSQLAEATRFMGQSKHIGKVILSMDDPDVILAPPAVPDALFRPDASYLVTGGLRGFGLATAEWMAREGAGSLVLMGRSAPTSDVEIRLQSLRDSGVRVEVMRGDVSKAADVRRVLADVRSTMAPLRGIVHGAMVLDDASIVELDRERIDRVMAPKMTGAWHLHRETLDDDLDCFVMFSSLTSMFGNPLQANYAAANAFLDALAHHRRALGKPALAVNWGPLAKVGFVSRHRDVADYLERQGYHAFSPAQAFEILGMLLRRDVTQLMAARIDWARWADSSPTAAASAMLRHFAPAAGASAAQRGVSGSLRATIIAAPGGEQHGLVVAFLREKVGKVLGLSPSKLDAERSLTEYGLDSLIAVELMTMLRMELGVELAAVKLLQGISVAGLTALVLEQIGASGAAVTTAVNPVAAIVVEEGLAADRAIEPPQQAPAEMQAVSVLPLVPAPQHTNGAARYSTLDYARWTTGQRAVRGVVSAVMRTFTKLDVEGLEHLPLTGGCLLAINHVSMADVPVVLSVLPRRTIMFASDHLRNSAFMDWFLHDMGDAIYVRRGEGDTEALANGLAVLRAGGLLGLGPEGTRSHDGSLARGQTGIAYLATQANVPVVPLAAWGQENIASNLKRMRRPPISVRIGAPIHFAEQAPSTTRLREYTDQVMQSIASMLPPEYRGVYSDRVAS